jgi:hypothetical protein
MYRHFMRNDVLFYLYTIIPIHEQRMFPMTLDGIGEGIKALSKR